VKQRLRGTGLALSILALLAAGSTVVRPAAVGPPAEDALSRALPGAEKPTPDLARRLEAAWAGRDSGYVPRARHLNADGTPSYTNRLFLESSPYLRQHAHNPVNWFPWGDEAFERARRLKRPVLLSIGYSTCHWCHVMEEESFEDEGVARYMNESYVAIKVDREERPDLDVVYQRAVQMLTGSGGWPLTVWLTPDRRPFYGGAYFPAHDGDRGMPVGFLSVLRRLREAYDQEPSRVDQAATRIAQAIRSSFAIPSGGSLPGAAVLDAAYRRYASGFDSVYGGLMEAPRFPSSLPIRFLLHYYHRTGNPQALAMVRLTLERMAAGGIYDQIGGGFHRYSTDGRWLVPHFEKMLYDNARLAVEYLEGWQVTREPSFQRVAREILRYVERDMTSPDGAFYSATDADSRAADGGLEEGRFFTWNRAEIEAALQRDQARIVEHVYGVSAAGNFEGRSILSLRQPLDHSARALGLAPAALQTTLDHAREALYLARKHRPQPFRDEKVLAAWNGLMISAFARASLVLGEPAYARSAERAAAFVLDHMRRDSGLARSFVRGRAEGAGVLEDYAFMIAGLLDLYEATGGTRWLSDAVALDGVLVRLYADSTGGFFMTAADQDSTLARQKPGYDGPEPSGNSVQALNLLRLAELTGDDHYRGRADRVLAAFAPSLSASPTALSELLLALDFRIGAPREVVIVTPHARAEAEPLLAKLRAAYVPNRVLAVAAEGRDLDEQARLVPLLEGKRANGGRATAYVCERGACKLPTTDPDLFARQLAGGRPR